MECIFINDNNVKILLPETHPFSQQYSTRVHAEALFRKITSYLIVNNMIKNNIIDLGCWMGDNVIPWAKNINGIIYAIDPSEQNCSFIKLLSEINNVSNVQIIQNAISDKNEILSTNDPINHCSFVYPPVGTDGQTKVNAYSLDYLYSEKVIGNIDYIHLDVEGMEFKVVLGANEIIDNFRPIVAFEQHIESENYMELAQHFKNKNYIVYLINESFPGCRHDCRNLIAFPCEKIYSELINDIHVYLNQNNILINI